MERFVTYWASNSDKEPPEKLQSGLTFTLQITAADFPSHIMQAQFNKQQNFVQYV